jgi:hypothetical protein
VAENQRPDKHSSTTNKKSKELPVDEVERAQLEAANEALKAKQQAIKQGKTSANHNIKNQQSRTREPEQQPADIQITRYAYSQYPEQPRISNLAGKEGGLSEEFSSADSGRVEQ